MKKNSGTDLLTSPLIQSLITGGLGYGLTDYLYPKITNSTNLPFINSIKDPRERARVLAKYQKNLADNQNTFRNFAGAVGALAPLWFNRDTIKRGWNTKNEKGNSQGLSGAIAAVIGGDSSVKNLKQPIDHAKIGLDASSEKEPLEKESSYMNNALEGSGININDLKPLTSTASFEIPTMDSIRRLNSYPTNSLLGAQNTAILTQGLTNASNGIGAGMISVDDIAKGITRMGVGYGVGKLAGVILGTVLSQPVALKDKMSTGMGLAASIANTGILSHLIK